MSTIFEIDLMPLPCFQEGLNEAVYSDLLSIYAKEFKEKKSVKFLEIGTGTGCQIAVIYKACLNTSVFYVGIDINPHTLLLANQTANVIKNKHGKFEFVLIEGNSNVTQVQRSITLSGPYGIIHIDGDTKPKSIANDLILASNSLTKNGILVIGNYETNPDIKFAVDFSLRQNMFAEIEVINGIAVIYKSKRVVVVEQKYEKKPFQYKQNREKIYTGMDDE